jgi:hypothetical protein
MMDGLEPWIELRGLELRPDAHGDAAVRSMEAVG